MMLATLRCIETSFTGFLRARHYDVVVIPQHSKEAAVSDIKSKTSPVVAIAATSITLFSLVGIGVLTGIIPSSFSKDTELPAAAVAPAPEQHGARDRAARKTSEPVRVATASTSATAQPRRVAAAACSSCGTVSAVNVVERKGEGSGVGAVAGGVVGGLLGNQVGGGNGRTLATVAGVAGGALAGNEVEKRYKSEHRYQVAVNMDDGTTRHFTYEAAPGYEPGDKVKVVDGRLVR
jgi:outer membrane lipoprotein SlyB